MLAGPRQDQDVGVVCTESSVGEDVVIDVGSGDTVGLDRLVETVAFEAWLPVRPGVRSYGFVLPADGAFSYEGENVRFAWRVAARPRNGRGPQATAPLWGRP